MGASSKSPFSFSSLSSGKQSGFGSFGSFGGSSASPFGSFSKTSKDAPGKHEASDAPEDAPKAEPSSNKSADAPKPDDKESFSALLKGDNEKSGATDESGEGTASPSTKPLDRKTDLETGEEGEETLHSTRAKLYVIDVDKKSWKERGVGLLKVNVKRASDGKVESGRLGKSEMGLVI